MLKKHFSNFVKKLTNFLSPIATLKKKIGGGKTIVKILGVLLLVGGIGTGIFLTQQQQIFQPKADCVGYWCKNCQGVKECNENVNITCEVYRSDVLKCGSSNTNSSSGNSAGGGTTTTIGGTTTTPECASGKTMCRCKAGSGCIDLTKYSCATYCGGSDNVIPVDGGSSGGENTVTGGGSGGGGYSFETVVNTAAELNRAGYDCRRGGCAPGVMVSGYYEYNGKWYAIGGTGNNPANYISSSLSTLPACGTGLTCHIGTCSENETLCNPSNGPAACCTKPKTCDQKVMSTSSCGFGGCTPGQVQEISQTTDCKTTTKCVEKDSCKKTCTPVTRYYGCGTNKCPNNQTSEVKVSNDCTETVKCIPTSNCSTTISSCSGKCYFGTSACSTLGMKSGVGTCSGGICCGDKLTPTFINTDSGTIDQTIPTNKTLLIDGSKCTKPSECVGGKCEGYGGYTFCTGTINTTAKQPSPAATECNTPSNIHSCNSDKKSFSFCNNSKKLDTQNCPADSICPPGGTDCVPKGQYCLPLSGAVCKIVKWRPVCSPCEGTCKGWPGNVYCAPKPGTPTQIIKKDCEWPEWKTPTCTSPCNKTVTETRTPTQYAENGGIACRPQDGYRLCTPETNCLSIQTLLSTDTLPLPITTSGGGLLTAPSGLNTATKGHGDDNKLYADFVDGVAEQLTACQKGGLTVYGMYQCLCSGMDCADQMTNYIATKISEKTAGDPLQCLEFVTEIDRVHSTQATNCAKDAAKNFASCAVNEGLVNCNPSSTRTVKFHPGDQIVWTSIKGNESGHIAVCVEVIDGGNKCRIAEANYDSNGKVDNTRIIEVNTTSNKSNYTTIVRSLTPTLIQADACND